MHKFKIDPNYESIFSKFQQKIKNIENIHNDPEQKIRNKFTELKTQVQSDKKVAIREIERLSEAIMARLDSLESDFIKDCKAKCILDYYGKLIHFMNNELRDFEKCLKSLKNVDEDRRKKSKEIQDLLSRLDKESDEYENKLFKHKSISYVPVKAEIKNLFGSLNVSSLKKFI